MDEEHGTEEAIVAPSTTDTATVVGVVPVVGAHMGEVSTEGGREFTWHVDRHPDGESRRLMEHLGQLGTFFRNAGGALYRMILGKDPIVIANTTHMEAAIRDEGVRIRVVNETGKVISRSVPQSDLRYLLASREMKERMPHLDFISRTPFYSREWKLAQPGYNDFGPGERVYFNAAPVSAANGCQSMMAFLKAMSFASPADLANAVAGIITRVLRYRWPGRKPFIPVTANRSHAGKDTVLDFISGTERRVDISWSKQDWPTQLELVQALSNPDVAMVSLGNVRVGSTPIASSIVERLVTDQAPLLQSTKRSMPFQRRADFLFAATANQGKFSIDLQNRGLQIALHMEGDIAERHPAIGNPRWEYLPAHRDEIEAEVHGLIRRWIEAGCPQRHDMRHPMSEWAAVVGGILMVADIPGFLDNWEAQRSASDPLLEELALLATTAPGKSKTASEWVQVMKSCGSHLVLVDSTFRSHDHRLATELGKVLSAHEGSLIHAVVQRSEGDTIVDLPVVYRLKKDRKRSGGEPKYRYVFEPVGSEVPTNPTKDVQRA